MNFLSIFIQSFFEALDGHNSLAVTVSGWLGLFLLGLYATKIQQRNAARMEIYKELHKLKSAIDVSSVELGILLSKFSLPFLAMEWAEKSSVGLGEGKTPGQLWLENNRKIIDAVSRFDQNHQAFLNAANTWISIMPTLKTARNTLAAESAVLSQLLWAYVQFHMSQPTKEYDWKKWDRGLIEARTLEIRSKYDRVAIGFLNDFTDLLHDELIHPIFDIKKVHREDFYYVTPVESETLTKKGIKIIKYSPTEVALVVKKTREGVGSK